MAKVRQRPFISVVIPALNEAAYLPQALATLQQQTYKDFEVIVADNGSTDSTAAIAKSYGARVVSETAPGVCAARDTGTKAARGQIIVSTDADTQFKPDWLAKIAAEFNDPKVVLVTGPPAYIKAPLWGKIYERSLFGLVALSYKLTGRPFYVSACNLAFRKSAWTGYNRQLTQGGDELYVLKQLAGQGRISYLRDNPVPTSPRRLKKGFLYNFVMTFLGYYLGDYIFSRLTKRSLLGSYPAIRDDASQRAYTWKTASFVIVLAVMIYAAESHPGLAQAVAKHRPHLHKLPNVALYIDRDGRKIGQ